MLTHGRLAPVNLIQTHAPNRARAHKGTMGRICSDFMQPCAMLYAINVVSSNSKCVKTSGTRAQARTTRILRGEEIGREKSAKVVVVLLVVVVVVVAAAVAVAVAGAVAIAVALVAVVAVVVLVAIQNS